MTACWPDSAGVRVSSGSFAEPVRVFVSLPRRSHCLKCLSAFSPPTLSSVPTCCLSLTPPPGQDGGALVGLPHPLAARRAGRSWNSDWRVMTTDHVDGKKSTRAKRTLRLSGKLFALLTVLTSTHRGALPPTVQR